MTDKQIQFCNEYIKDFNITKAAARAGYSESTAYSIGSEVLKKPEIRAKIDELLKALIPERNQIVYQNIKYWMEVRDDEENSQQDRLRASEMLGKYASMFTTSVELTGKDGEAVKMQVEFVEKENSYESTNN